jgi:hypothetical protein
VAHGAAPARAFANPSNQDWDALSIVGGSGVGGGWASAGEISCRDRPVAQR